MGIDIYMEWDGFTDDDKKKQLQGFDATIGDAGYLREAYHGNPYATRYLVQEAFKPEKYSMVKKESDEKFGWVRIANSLLVDRLPETIKISIERNMTIYNQTFDESLPYIKSFIDFVALHSKMERDGRNPRILASF